MTDDVTIDLTGYKDRAGARVAPGRYRVLVEDVEKDQSSNNNPMINVWLRIQGGEFDGVTLLDRLVLTDKSLFRVVGFMQALGLPTPHKRIKVNIRQWVGRVLDVDVDDADPYNGRVKSEVRGYLKVASAARGDDVADLDVSAVREEDLPGDDALSAFTGEAQAEAAAKNGQVDQPAQSTEPESTEVDLDSLDLG